jgi:hypothetical protein
MNPSAINASSETGFEDSARLIQAAIDDTVINTKLLALLYLDPVRRCSVLNSWLEQLHNQDAPEKLIHLIILF